MASGIMRTSTLNMLLVVAIVATCVGIGVCIATRYPLSNAQRATSSNIPVRDTQLGAAGSVCGGSQRLPCMPGFRCATSAGAMQGVCVATEERKTDQRRALNETCGVNDGWCEVGAVCRPSSREVSGVCVKAWETSLSVLKLTLDGMSHDGTTYIATPGSSVRISVQALNAKSVTAVLGPTGGERSIVLSRGEGGVFTGECTVPSGLNGDLQVLTTDDRGQTAAMSVKVRTE